MDCSLGWQEYGHTSPDGWSPALRYLLLRVPRVCRTAWSSDCCSFTSWCALLDPETGRMPSGWYILDCSLSVSFCCCTCQPILQPTVRCVFSLMLLVNGIFLAMRRDSSTRTCICSDYCLWLHSRFWFCSQ